MTRVANWVSRILVVLIGYTVATLALRFVPVDNSIAVASVDVPVEVPAVSTPSTTEMANDAARQHIFGVAGTKPKPTLVRETAKRETNLNLKLLGVYSAEPADQALAIISPNGKPEEVFRVGETIIGGASLAEVRKTQVIINNGGQLETLNLPEKVASTGRSSSNANLPGSNLPAANNTQGGDDGAPIELPESPKEIRDTLARNPALLNKLVSAVPYRENGRILGYRLTPKQSGGLLETYGVFAGDVVTRVNGIALANQKNGIRALRKLVKASTVDLTILRDGVELPINIPLQ